jgi:hypothetical protein
VLTIVPQDLCETVGDVPKNIGTEDLKWTGVTALAHKFMKWMKLTVDDVELRTEQWEELLPKGEGRLNVDAIAAKLHKKVGGKLRFAPKLIHLVLALPYEKYDVALAHSLGEGAERLITQKVVHSKTDVGANCTHS